MSEMDDARRSVEKVERELLRLHDKKIEIVAQTQKVTASLERLQKMRVSDKHFTIYRRPTED